MLGMPLGATHRVVVEVTLRRNYWAQQETRALAKQDVISRAMRDFNVPRDAIDATVFDVVD